MDRSQWTHLQSKKTAMIDSPLNHRSKWPINVTQTPQSMQSASWSDCYYPVPLTSESIAPPSQPAFSQSVLPDPPFAESGVYNNMSSGIAQFPYLVSEKSPTPPISDHGSPYPDHLQNITSQPNVPPSHALRHNSQPEVDHPSAYHNAHSNPYPSGASAVSTSGHASEEEGTTTKEQEEQLLLQLKDEQNQSWKKIAVIFKSQCNKDYSVPALQMRYRRLRQRRLLDFNDADQAALMAAYDYWETKRWDIICEKMVEYGATDSWTPKACSAAWLRLKNREGSMKTQGHSLGQEADIRRPMEVQK